MPLMLEIIIQSIPRESGSYLLWLYLPRNQDLTVGRLGRFNFPAGDYIYIGSAHGPGGLRARLGRHLHGSGKQHWHVDYLRTAALVSGFGCQISAAHFRSALHLPPTECVWSQRLAVLSEAGLPVPGFGASDCRSGCAAHLVYFPDNIQQIPERIADQTSVCLRII
jgi:Uri superfamily endonuclease